MGWLYGLGSLCSLHIILIRSNKMQQYAGIYLLQNHSLHVLGVPSHPSPGEHKTVTAVLGTGHSIWATTFLQRGQRPRWRKVVAQILWPVPRTAVTVLCSPDDGCDGHPKHVEGDFAVNKYLHTVASGWILLIYNYDAWNQEYKIVVFTCQQFCSSHVVQSQNRKCLTLPLQFILHY